jgi:WD40 repeat protein
MSTDPEPGAGTEASVDARGAMGVQVGDGNFQVNYSYRLTLTDGVAPPPLVSVSGVIDSPYRGLRAFGERDAAFFFGREAAAAEVLERISRQLPETGLLVVSGVSGAGKSSLLQAGVLPRLRGAGLASAREAASWPCLVLTPAHAPLDELAVRVASLTGADAAEARRGLEADPAGFALTARQAALARTGAQAEDPGPRLLLVVDQFEQLFTQCADEEQRRAFITALHASAAASPGRPPAALVVLVVRADFEARCADYPQLVGAVQDRYLVTSMTDRQLRLAITEPARKAGSGVDADLVEVLLRELSSRPGAVSGAGVLPLLSHALDQAWRNRAGDLLTLADYERTGGIEGAVADSAERAFDSLTPAQQVAARQVFTRLTATSSDGADTASRVSHAELIADKTVADVRDVEAVLEAFAAERLLTLAAGTVEMSHEVLLTAWHLLRDIWLAETRADRIVRTRLDNVAADWEHSSRDRSYLYSGSLLQAAAETATRIRADPTRHPPLTQAEHDFLRASNRALRWAVRRRQGLIAFLAALALSLGAVAVAAVSAQQSAVHARNDALAGQLIAQSGSSLADTDPALAKMESIAAWRIAPSDASEQARDAMLNAATLPGIAVLDDKDGAVSSVAFSPDGKTLAIGDRDGTVRLWDLVTGQPIGDPFNSKGGAVGSVAFSPDGKTLAVGVDRDTGGAVWLWNVATGHRIGGPLSNQDDEAANSVAFSPDGKTLAIGPANIGVDGGVGGPAQLWDVATHREIHQVTTTDSGAFGSDCCSVGSVAFSPDGKTAAGGGIDGKGNAAAWLWNVVTGHQIGKSLTADTSGGAVTSVAFSPDGKTLATGEGDLDGNAVARLWNAATGHEIGNLLTADTSGGAVTSVAFSPDGKTVATGGDDGTVRLWDVATRRPVGNPLADGGVPVTSVAFSPDGKTLASGNEDGAAELWDVGVTVNTSTGMPVTGIPDDADSVAFSPDGKTLAVGVEDEPPGYGYGYAAGVWLWSTLTGHQIGNPLTGRTGGSAVPSVAFSPDGKTLATSTGSVTVNGQDSGPAQVWDIATRRQTGTIANGGTIGNGDLSATNAGAFSPDGRILAIGGDNNVAGGVGAVWLWNVATRHQIGGMLTPDLLSGGVTSVAFSPDGQVLAVGGFNDVNHINGAYDGAVWLLNVATGHPIGSIQTGSGAVTSVAFSPDSKTLVTGGSDGTARLWDVATRRQVGNPLTGGGGAVGSVAFSPDGQALAVGGTNDSDGDGTVQLWDVATDEQIGGVLNMGPGAVSSVAFSPDGKTLAAADGHGPARLWNVGYLVNPIPYLCASAKRFVTPTEWAEKVPGVPYQSVCPGDTENVLL